VTCFIDRNSLDANPTSNCEGLTYILRICKGNFETSQCHLGLILGVLGCVGILPFGRKLPPFLDVELLF
jgi:hypothetical protein